MALSELRSVGGGTLPERHAGGLGGLQVADACGNATSPNNLKKWARWRERLARGKHVQSILMKLDLSWHARSPSRSTPPHFYRRLRLPARRFLGSRFCVTGGAS